MNHTMYCNYHDVGKYVDISRERQPIELGRRLSPREEIERYMVYAVYNLRLSKSEFRETFGIAMTSVFGEIINALIEDALVVEQEDRYDLTLKGKLYVFNISKMFFSKHSRMMIDFLEDRTGS